MTRTWVLTPEGWVQMIANPPPPTPPTQLLGYGATPYGQARYGD